MERESVCTTQKSIIQESVIENLLAAHKRIAESGRAGDVIELSKYLLHLSKQVGDVFVNISPKSDENRGSGPIKQL